jgi:hypothetical protein
VGADAAGTAATAIAAHAAAADPHPGYLTPAEGNAAYAPIGQGVTNGNNHNHDGGDGGQIAYGSLSGLPTLGTAAATDANAYATAAQGTKADTAVQPAALNAKADLVGGVVPTSQIPAIAISDYLGAVGSQTAMLALVGQRGDWCLRTDPPMAGMWVLGADNSALLASWVQIPVPTVPVQSVNAQTGIITLGTGDLAESDGNLFFTAARAIGAALTGFNAEAGTVVATDSILQAFQKMVGNIANRALSGAIGSSGLTQSAGILGAASAGTPQVYTPIGLAFNGTNLATLADIIIPLSGEAVALTASSTVAKVTIPYWPRTTIITDPWIWAVATAPTGAALQFDIQVNGTSIYLPANGGTYPTIGAGLTNSTASAGTFTTAFAAAPTIPVGSSVGFFVRQVGSTVAGINLKVIAPTRRAG